MLARAFKLTHVFSNFIARVLVSETCFVIFVRNGKLMTHQYRPTVGWGKCQLLQDLMGTTFLVNLMVLITKLTGGQEKWRPIDGRHYLKNAKNRPKDANLISQENVRRVFLLETAKNCLKRPKDALISDLEKVWSYKLRLHFKQNGHFYGKFWISTLVYYTLFYKKR